MKLKKQKRSQMIIKLIMYVFYDDHKKNTRTNYNQF